mmetsp:Transcript_46339/g.105670  ORF Transcript_46339/g.105670 Transcript_46339/m.105670 type:complete len:133 (+) Transcript_46339:25-423(+)
MKIWKAAIASMAQSSSVQVLGAGSRVVNGLYASRPAAQIPAGFAATCRTMGWDSAQTWKKLSDQKRPWYEKTDGSYVYWNTQDHKWWIDGPDGAGLYVVRDDSGSSVPPGKGWTALSGAQQPVPSVEVKDEL